MKFSGWLYSLAQDLRYGLRLLRLNPGFTAIVVLSLALGTGANTAIFQLIDSLRLRTLPVSNPQQLADVRILDTSWRHGRVHGRYPDITNAQWEQIRDHQRVFSSMLAWATEGGFNLARGGEARYASGIWVSGDFFKTLEVRALRGRTLTAEDDRRGCGSPPAVISYAFWQREYGGGPDAVGRMISLDGHSFEIVGITPPSFAGIDVGRQFDVAVPLCSEALMHGESSLIDLRNGYWLSAVGRLKPGVTIEQANAEMAALSTGILEATVPPQYDAEAQKHFMQYKFGAFPAATGFSNLRRRYETPLWMLLAIAAMVLLIACANIGNLLLARASARGREIAVRLSLGASRARLIRQLLVESLLIGVAGTVLGAVLAQWISRFLVAFIGTSAPDVYVDLHPDSLVLSFTTAIALLTTILFGMAPAFGATRVAPAAALKSAGRNLAGGRERFSLRRGLVVSQVAFSLVLLVGAMLFVRSLKNILSVDAGFQTAGIMEADLDFSQLKIPAPQRQTYKLNLIDRLRALPGVEGVADASVVPLSGFGWSNNVILAGATKPADVSSSFTQVSPDFFSTMEMPIVAGRAFNEGDRANSPKVAVVNQSFVKKILNGGNPIGARFQIEEEVGRARPVYEIVGLVRDTKYYDLRDEFAPEAYVTTAQDDQPDEGARLLVRSSLPAGTLTQELKSALSDASPEIGTEFHVMETNILQFAAARKANGHAFRIFRRAGHVTGHDGAVRRDVQFRRAPHRRNRVAHSAGGATAKYFGYGAGRSRHHAGDRPGRRRRAGAGLGQNGGRDALRPQPLRPADDFAFRSCTYGCGHPRQLLASAPSGAARSHGRPPRRIKSVCWSVGDSDRYYFCIAYKPDGIAVSALLMTVNDDARRREEQIRGNGFN